ncbi:MAG: ABC transporter substrate-binding protein [Rhizobiaceae bacterium]|nr:ABC transporter substrate-binding protein [Rhizobiaceae bacterium]
MIARTVARAAGALSVLLALLAPAGAVDLAGPVPDTSRVVAIGGSITEIVFALGEQEMLVARDSTSVFPPAAFDLPDIGYMRAISPEGVLSVSPTAILALAGTGPTEAVEVLRKAAVPYVEIPDAFDAAGIVDKIERVGKALGVDDRAKALSEQVSADLEKTHALVSAIAERKKVLFILSFQDGKILGAGEGTAANGILTLAGADNAVHGFPGYKPLTDEAILEGNPDVILVMDRGGGGDHSAQDAQLLAHPAIASTPAGQNKALVRMDGAYLLGFGPRTAVAARDLAAALYGDALPKP